MSGRTGTALVAVRTPGRVGTERGSGASPVLHTEGQPALRDPDWPLITFLELGALPSAVPCARLHAKHVLWEWRLDHLSEVVELIVSELVTNAHRASVRLKGSQFGGRWAPGVPPVRLWLRSDGVRVLIQVWDGDHRLPKPRSADVESETGRGLMLVTTLCSQWGTYPLENSSGKVVWAQCV